MFFRKLLDDAEDIMEDQEAQKRKRNLPQPQHQHL